MLGSGIAEFVTTGFKMKFALVVFAAVVAFTAIMPTEVSARHRRMHTMTPAEYDRMCGRLPAYGFDGCGHPEFSYGDGCSKRFIANTPEGPRPRRLNICR